MASETTNTEIHEFEIQIRVTRNGIDIERVTPQDEPVIVAMSIGLEKHGTKAFWRGVQLIREAATDDRALSNVPLGEFLTMTVMHRDLFEQHKNLPARHFVQMMAGAAREHEVYKESFPPSYRELQEMLNMGGENRVDPRPTP
jgi:hypothetical protein